MSKTYYWLEKSRVYHETRDCGAFRRRSLRTDQDGGNLRHARGECVGAEFRHAFDTDTSATYICGKMYQRRPCKRCGKG